MMRGWMTDMLTHTVKSGTYIVESCVYIDDGPDQVHHGLMMASKHIFQIHFIYTTAIPFVSPTERSL